jgi:RNA 2'-phosphotransferase, Tpt1 / KptA family
VSETVYQFGLWFFFCGAAAFEFFPALQACLLSKVCLIMSEDVVIPRLDDRQKVHLSKALSYILRHGATKEKLVMTDDGYIQVQEIVSF